MTCSANPRPAESQTAVRIAGNRRVGAGVHLLRFRAPAIARAAQPGQFLHLLAPGMALLRRPFSIHDIDGDGIAILYRIAGQGTALLSRLRQGEPLDVVGPLGRPFAIENGRPHHIVVAGGIGIAPLQLLLRRLRAAKLSPLLCYGCATKTELRPHLRVKRIVATDDGSCGAKGFVTAALEAALDRYPGAQLYGCGPWPMLKALAAIAARRRLPCQVSLESFMACGVGACQGCVVKAVDGYRTVCHDGPVFESAAIDWDQEPVV
ncbi:MAG TPA: dihydroorotate dehydrogenase electron transfer subunit [Candidatus Edwardsbacteria bacterium]|nr:dihydroorotate dehydrogenase electron transfer subunit [Candidatus Edwardsbacteria bacterium]